MTESEETENEMNCGLSVAERDLLQARLATLEDTVPPRTVWKRIEAQARAEGLFRRRAGESVRWFAGTGIAAAVVLAVLNFPVDTPVVDDGGVINATPPPSVATANQAPANLSALMVQSQQIERNLAIGIDAVADTALDAAQAVETAHVSDIGRLARPG